MLEKDLVKMTDQGLKNIADNYKLADLEKFGFAEKNLMKNKESGHMQKGIE